MNIINNQTHILVIDNSKTDRMSVSSYLREAGYQVVEAADEKEGLAVCEEQFIDLILLDMRIPTVDGFLICSKLQSYSKLKFIPIILLSVHDDVELKVRAFECGAVDFINKPVTESELLARVQIRLNVHQLTEYPLEGSTYHQELMQGLYGAAELQRNLLPKSVPDCQELLFASYFMPSHEVSGDLFNIQRLSSNHLAIYILDVSGHGSSAAMMTALATQALSGFRAITRKKGQEEGDEEQIVSPKEVVSELNKEFPIARFDHYMTIAYLLLNLKDNRFSYCCAGHPPIVHVTKEGDVSFLGKGGPPAGMDGVWEEGEGSLNSGDRLFFYTDGVVDHRNEAGEVYGEKRLVDSMVANWGYPLMDATCNIIDTLEDFGGHLDDGEDDMTLLAVEKK